MLALLPPRSGTGIPRLLLQSLCILLVIHCQSVAADVVDSGGFESAAGYVTTIDGSPAALNGQEGWVTTLNNAGSAIVQNSVVHPSGGTQAVRVDRGANSDDRWAVPVGPLTIAENRLIVIDWDMYVLANTSPNGIGPFFGVEAYDATSGFKVLGSLGVDTTTGDVLYQAQGSGVFVESGAGVNAGQWHNFQIKLGFGSNRYQGSFDNQVLASTGFVDGASNHFTDADIAALAAALDANSQAATGTAYFDNFLVRNVSQADFDVDEDVDANDLFAWQSGYGTNPGGDANLDGKTTGSDFLIWQREYDPGNANLTLAASQVPEPSSLALVLLAILGLNARIRSLG